MAKTLVAALLAACLTVTAAVAQQRAPGSAPAPATGPSTGNPAATPPSTATAPAGAAQFRTEADAKARCGADPVVWTNLKSKIYHYAGTGDYGRTKSGVYQCEKDAVAGGARAARNERRPS